MRAPPPHAFFHFSFSLPQRPSLAKAPPQLVSIQPICQPLVLMACAGAWEGSKVHEDHIDFLC